MLHYLNTFENLAAGCSDTTVLDRQMKKMKWQQEHSYFSSSLHVQNSHMFSMVTADSTGTELDEVVAQALTIKTDPVLNTFDVSCTMSRTFSCPPTLVEAKATDLSIEKESCKKRKTNQPQNLKFAAEDDNKDKRIKVDANDGESKIVGKPSTRNNTTTLGSNSKETFANTSNSKVSEVQKPDYIHVRARRGQATDSHSLAERVRREKISERMKFLQDLVPGCKKITGKAGMLDEIINYVQSLQQQVEFLSMKLATVSPWLDFNIDDPFDKEVFPACATNFPNIGMSSNMTSPTYLQFNSPQQILYGGLDSVIKPLDMGLRRTISSPVSMPETFLDSPCFTQMLPSSAWEGDFQNLHNLDFGSSTSNILSFSVIHK